MTDGLAEVIRAKSPRAHPQRRADRVVGEKSPPAHADAAGDEAVQLAQQRKEPRDQHDRTAVTPEERLDGGEAAFGDADARAMADDQPPATKMSDRKPYVVAEHRGEPGAGQEREQDAARPRPRARRRRSAWPRRAEAGRTTRAAARRIPRRSRSDPDRARPLRARPAARSMASPRCQCGPRSRRPLSARGSAAGGARETTRGPPWRPRSRRTPPRRGSRGSPRA